MNDNLERSATNPVDSERAILTGINLDAHLEGVGDGGSFRLVASRRGTAHLIASVKITDGRPVVFLDEVTLRLGAPRAMREAGLTSYDDFKRSVVEQLRAMLPQANDPDPSARLRWPWKCVFHCPQHEVCENYDWVGFWED